MPKKRDPKGPVRPIIALQRRMARGDYAAAFLTRLIVFHYGEKLADATVQALVLLTPPAQWPAHKWPDRIAWFHDWRRCAVRRDRPRSKS